MELNNLEILVLDLNNNLVTTNIDLAKYTEDVVVNNRNSVLGFVLQQQLVAEEPKNILSVMLYEDMLLNKNTFVIADLLCSASHNLLHVDMPNAISETYIDIFINEGVIRLAVGSFVHDKQIFALSGALELVKVIISTHNKNFNVENFEWIQFLDKTSLPSEVIEFIHNFINGTTTVNLEGTKAIGDLSEKLATTEEVAEDTIGATDEQKAE